MNFQQFFEALALEQVEYVLVGGLAVSMHGVVRGTMDVDIVLAMDDANVGRFIGLARRHGLTPSMPVALESLADAAQLDAWHREKGMIAFSLREAAPSGLVVDLLVRPSVAFESLSQAAVHKRFGATGIPVASVAHLIQLKTGTGRSIDAFDVAQLSRLKSDAI